LGMSRATISQLETGVIAELGVRKLSQVCDRLGLEVAVRRRDPHPTLLEAYAENRQERQAAFKETDATLARMSEDKGHG
jgi:transcriptional regulator with XRE-family HTH domain